MSRRATRTCTKCLVTKTIHAFYSKGSRIDSRCKECVKSIKKTKYVAQEQRMQTDSLFKFFELITELEVSALKIQTLRLDEEIRCLQSKQQ